MDTKICTKCQQELPITDFYWRNQAKGIRRSDCKYCHNKYVRSKYHERKDAIDSLKSAFTCAKCGETRAYCLDFHHKDPSIKDNTIARMTSHQVSQDTLNNELSKCIVLCANCHREFHYLKALSQITLEEYLM